MPWETYKDRFPVHFILPWKTGRWYESTPQGNLTTGTMGTTQIYCTAICVPNPAGVTATSIGLEYTVNALAGGLARFAIYRDDDGFPGDLIIDAGTVAVDAGAAAFQSASISQYLAQGWHWMAVTASGGGTVRFSASGYSAAIYPRRSEGSLALNSLGITYTAPEATTVALHLNSGFPEVFSREGVINHANYPRVMIGI